MNGKAGKRVDRGLGPLPYIADQIIVITGLKTIHRTGRTPVFQIDITGGRIPIRLVQQIATIIQPMPLILGGQPDRFSCLCRFPGTTRLGLQTVDLHRPVPGHVDLTGHGAQFPAVVNSLNPEQGKAVRDTLEGKIPTPFRSPDMMMDAEIGLDSVRKKSYSRRGKE